MAKRMKSCHRAAKLAPKRKPVMCQFDSIPEDVLFMILQLLPLRDAMRTGVLAQNLLRAWRFYPNLEFTTRALGLNRRVHKGRRRAKFVRCVNGIVRHHAGTGVKSFVIKHNLHNHKYANYLDRWIYFAVSSGARELTLDLRPRRVIHRIQYTFPSSNFAAPQPTCVEHLKLCYCYLRQPTSFSGLRNLRTLDLSVVYITQEDLESLLSCTLSLEQLKLNRCPQIEHLKISEMLCKLNHLDIRSCPLNTLEIRARNLATFNYDGWTNFKTVICEASLLKEARFELIAGDAADYALSELAPLMPNLETLYLVGYTQMIIPARDPTNKFSSLKHLEMKMDMSSRKHGLLCLVSFLDAAPFLEKFIVHLYENLVYYGEEAALRRLEKREPHRKLKVAKMSGYAGTKSSIELALHILENSTALECLILDPRLDKFAYKYIYSDDVSEVTWRLYHLFISKYLRKSVPSYVRLSSS
ncbi:F-box/FBD/LRR-repeat protein At1g13570 isoform X1 [Lolium perenne]|uniref:F-box/FBD/LRR-repeat protein At1g13570 isoform X1 n=1 Tax=Lolium perenne TaxID=4522 RepID=UPI0021F6715E|nr:F-box/FBD/LRR-repeat protein At1g13570-like isoform X1 [Lolium perenne]